MALKKTPANAGRRVPSALPKGKPNAPTPHFVPVKAPGAPKAGVKQPFSR